MLDLVGFLAVLMLEFMFGTVFELDVLMLDDFVFVTEMDYDMELGLDMFGLVDGELPG